MQPYCFLCSRSVAELRGPIPCASCQTKLQLPKGGLQGDTPLHWRALGHYKGALRSLPLELRQSSDNQRLKSLIALLEEDTDRPVERSSCADPELEKSAATPPQLTLLKV